MSKTTIIAIVAVLVALVAGGLAYWFYYQNNVAAPTPKQIYNSAGGAQPAQTSYVYIKNFGFEPANLTVTKGTLVIWDNLDNVAHTAVGDKGGPLSPRMNPGNSYGYTFNAVGSFPYHCSIHPTMKGTVTVVQ